MCVLTCGTPSGQGSSPVSRSVRPNCAVAVAVAVADST